MQSWEVLSTYIPLVMPQLKMVGSFMSKNDDSQDANHAHEVNDVVNTARLTCLFNEAVQGPRPHAVLVTRWINGAVAVSACPVLPLKPDASVEGKVA